MRAAAIEADVIACSDIERAGLVAVLRQQRVAVRPGAPLVVAGGICCLEQRDGRPVVVLSVGDERQDLLAVRKGACAVAGPQMLREALAAAAWGMAVLPSGLVRRLVQRDAARQREVRRRQLAELLVAGCSNREIARELGISLSLVKREIARLREQRGARRRHDLAVMLAADGPWPRRGVA